MKIKNSFPTFSFNILRSIPSLILILSLAACSGSMRVEVEVYKGPLSLTPEMQYAELKAMVEDAKDGVIKFKNFIEDRQIRKAYQSSCCNPYNRVNFDNFKTDLQSLEDEYADLAKNSQDQDLLLNSIKIHLERNQKLLNDEEKLKAVFREIERKQETKSKMIDFGKLEEIIAKHIATNFQFTKIYLDLLMDKYDSAQTFISTEIFTKLKTILDDIKEKDNQPVATLQNYIDQKKDNATEFIKGHLELFEDHLKELNKQTPTPNFTVTTEITGLDATLNKIIAASKKTTNPEQTISYIDLENIKEKYVATANSFIREHFNLIEKEIFLVKKYIPINNIKTDKLINQIENKKDQNLKIIKEGLEKHKGFLDEQFIKLYAPSQTIIPLELGTIGAKKEPTQFDPDKIIKLLPKLGHELKASFLQNASILAMRLKTKALYWSTHTIFSDTDPATKKVLTDFANMASQYGNQIGARSDVLQKQLVGEGDKGEVDRRRLPLSAYLRDTIPTDFSNLYPWNNVGCHECMEIQSNIFRHLFSDMFWSNINTVYAAGQGDMNMAVVKDEIGNWTLKSFDSDPSEIVDAFKDVTLASLELAAKQAATSVTGVSPSLLSSISEQVGGGGTSEAKPDPILGAKIKELREETIKKLNEAKGKSNALEESKKILKEYKLSLQEL